ncbi:MAG: hypothetical protein CM15mP125_2890 [Gammaproteobacteria bacterium]|nr:MAG: hypothetical protein CM15mP125_2890 [Gammaproteobacteria bacterium]
MIRLLGRESLLRIHYQDYELESQLYSMTLEWDLGGVTLKSLTSYQNDEIAIQRDNDRTTSEPCRHSFYYRVISTPRQTNKQQLPKEFNLISNEPAFGRLDWVAGVLLRYGS